MKGTVAALALGVVIGMGIGPALAGASSPAPRQDSTRALQDIASTLKSHEISRSEENTARALHNISRTLRSIDSTLKKRDR